MRKIILMMAASTAAGLLFVNVYNSLVDASNWAHSLQAARDYFSAANPGDFFRKFAPANQVLTLLALLVCWKGGSKVRLFCLLALLTAVASDALTFGYFYPRNAMLFNNAGDQAPATLQRVLNEWRSMNWVRSALVGLNLIFDFTTLMLLQKSESYHPENSGHVLHLPAHH